MRTKSIFALLFGAVVAMSCSKNTTEEINFTETPFYLEARVNGADWNAQGSSDCPDPYISIFPTDTLPIALFQSANCSEFGTIGGVITDFIGPGVYSLDEDLEGGVISYLYDVTVGPLNSTEGEIRVLFYKEPVGSSPGFVDIMFSAVVENETGTISKRITHGEARLMLVQP